MILYLGTYSLIQSYLIFRNRERVDTTLVTSFLVIHTLKSYFTTLYLNTLIWSKIVFQKTYSTQKLSSKSYFPNVVVWAGKWATTRLRMRTNVQISRNALIGRKDNLTYVGNTPNVSPTSAREEIERCFIKVWIHSPLEAF